MPESTLSLDQFVQEIDRHYRAAMQAVPLFSKNGTHTLSGEQKKTFAGVFYHLRGHFIQLMWFLANFTQQDAFKTVILHNIREEIGDARHLSHEMLYEQFAKACGIDIFDEIIHETHYEDFAKTYNRTHLQWMAQQTDHARIAAFAAYERLDNVDYPGLLDFAKTFDLPPAAMTFFSVHVHVEHFESTLDLLRPIWESEPQTVQKAFTFIYEHQLAMWVHLSERILGDGM